MALFDDLVARDPDNIELKRSLAITYERVGNLHLQAQQYDEAQAVFGKSHALKLALADNHQMRSRDLFFSYNKARRCLHQVGPYGRSV